MFFDPSATTPYDWNFRLGSIPVRVHPLFWLTTFLTASHTNAASVAAWFAACFLCILVHELGHVLAMRFTRGDGRVLLYGFGGLAIPQRAWRKSVAGQVLISAGGPLAGFVFAAVIVAAVSAAGGAIAVTTAGIGLPTVWAATSWGPFVNYLANHMLWINVYWGLINLVPVIPLDGGHMAQALLSTQPDGPRKAWQLSTLAGTIVAALGFMTGNTFLMIMFGLFAYQSWEQISQSSPRYGRY